MTTISHSWLAVTGHNWSAESSYHIQTVSKVFLAWQLIFLLNCLLLLFVDAVQAALEIKKLVLVRFCGNICLRIFIALPAARLTGNLDLSGELGKIFSIRVITTSLCKKKKKKQTSISKWLWQQLEVDLYFWKMYSNPSFDAIYCFNFSLNIHWLY